MRLLRCVSTINEGLGSDLFSIGLRSHIRSVFWTLTWPQYWRWKVPTCFTIALVLLWDGWMYGQKGKGQTAQFLWISCILLFLSVVQMIWVWFIAELISFILHDLLCGSRCGFLQYIDRDPTSSIILFKKGGKNVWYWEAAGWYLDTKRASWIWVWGW